MSATPTTKVFRGGGMTHLLVDDIVQINSITRPAGGRTYRIRDVALHGTFCHVVVKPLHPCIRAVFNRNLCSSQVVIGGSIRRFRKVLP